MVRIAINPRSRLNSFLLISDTPDPFESPKPFAPAFCLTSKMSHDHSRRGSCQPSVDYSALSFDLTFVSRRRDGCGRWLWRLVRRLFSLKLHDGVATMISSLLRNFRPLGENSPYSCSAG